jgi:outer membrane murein-binding lipoprotein Lpp
MNANLKRIVMLGAVLAVTVASGCASFDMNASTDGSSDHGTSSNEILQQLEQDSKAG